MSRFVELYGNRRVALQLPLGYASGLPYLLVGETLGTWMSTEGINLKTIGAFALCGLAYNLKILWAPLLDRYGLPLLDRRRGWLLLFQLLLVGGIAALGGVQPRAEPVRTALMAAFVAFLSASQDIVTDAYRADALREDERAAGISLFTVGYRLGMLAAGAVALVLVTPLGWPRVYGVLALTMLIGVVATLLSPSPERVIARPRTIVDAYVRPLTDLVRRRGATAVIAFVVLYRCGYLIALPMNAPFLIGLGFSTAQLGYWRKGVGLIATLIGGVVAGPAVARLGTRRALLFFGAGMALVHLSWIGLVYTGPEPAMLAIAIGVENFFIGLSTTALEAYLLELTNASFSATQFAALSSLSSLGGRLSGATSGVLAGAVGWPLFFGLTSAVALPSLWIARHLQRLTAPPPAARAGDPGTPGAPDAPSAGA